MISFTRHSAVFFILLTFAGCGAATQNIPVSTAPSGATVYVDGKETCITPCNVPLTRTQDHILTLQKEGYKQADVQISRQYDTAAVARGAVQSGTSASSMGASTEGAISNALLSTQAMEEQGTAYVLSPSSVVVELVQKGQAKAAPADNSGPIVISSDDLTPEDQKALARETGKSANTKTGQDEPIVITKDQLAPEDQQAVIRKTEPATLSGAVEENPEQAAEALLEAGAAAAPTIHTGKEWKSSHSSESIGSDGSYNKTTTSSGVSVGASVNPAEAGLGILHLLEDAEGKEKQTKPTQE